MAEPAKEPVPEALDALRLRHPGVAIEAYVKSSGDALVLSKIVAAERGRGEGSAVMTELCALADAQGLRIDLTPSGDFGGSVTRLREFYRRFGFVENKGRRRDFEVSETMYRPPHAR